MFNRPKISKEVLRCECMEVTPNGYAPDMLTQMRLNPPPFVYAIHQLVVHHLIETETKIPGGEDMATCVKQACVYRAVLTDLLLKRVDRLPTPEKTVVYSDPKQGYPILKDCLLEIKDNFVFDLMKPKTINRIWRNIRCAYGYKHAAPIEAILSNIAKRTENSPNPKSKGYL